MSTIKKISERRKKIINLLQRNKFITINELNSILKTSKITIRRDLNYLSEKGSIKKIQGGAAVLRTKEHEPPYIVRFLDMKKEKEIIGAYAASIIKENEIISIDVGSTLLELAKNIPKENNIKVITNWLPIINILANMRYLAEVFILGGRVNLNELSVVSDLTSKTLDTFNIDIAFIGVGGISPEIGFTDYNIEEIEIKKQFIKGAKKVIILADHSKFGRLAHLKIGNLQLADQIITSEGLNDEDKIKIEECGVKVKIVKESDVF